MFVRIASIFAKSIISLTCIVPLIFVICHSFRAAKWNVLPFTSLLEYDWHTLRCVLYFENYINFFQHSIYLHATFLSVCLATVCTIIVIPFGFLIAWSLCQIKNIYYEKMIYRLILLPMFIPSVVKLYAWVSVSRYYMAFFTHHTSCLLTTILLCVYSYLPLVIALIYDDMRKIDPDLVNAAADLGAKPFARIYYIALPLSQDSIAISALITFSMAIGEYIGPTLLSGGRLLTLGELAHNECFVFYNIPMSAVVSIVMILWSIMPFIILRIGRRK